MNILVIGAGVIGRVYAGKLTLAGNHVSVLARGRRLETLRKHGIILLHALNGKRETAQVRAIDHIDPGESFDLVIVAVRHDQVASVFPLLRGVSADIPVLFMVNNPLGYAQWAEGVGAGRLLIGFPGAGGVVKEPVVEYTIVSRLLQPTTLGEPGAGVSPRVRRFARLFQKAGFPVAVSADMDAWQKSHVAWVTPCAFGIYHAMAKGLPFSRSVESSRLTVQGIREGFSVLRDLGVHITPVKLKTIDMVPLSFMSRALQSWAATRHFEVVALRHTLNAKEEMESLAGAFMKLARASKVPTPALDLLYGEVPKDSQDLR